MRIAELFYSVQGEGMLVGMPSVFVRTSGCNLRCGFCDTPYTSWNPESNNQSVDDIIKQIKQFDCKYVVLTGGEPMIAPEIETLCSRLENDGHHITIETAATVFKPIQADLMSLSPKLANSTPPVESGWAERHDRDRINLEVIREFMDRYPYQLKFVIDQPGDIVEVQELLAQLPAAPKEHIFLMPQATSVEELVKKGRWIAELCKTHGYRFGPRLHIDLWGHTRGT
ncbi:MAG TPA: 7-carboxy-7-deazaguanine synthase QueE [Gemmatales bacterium]|nr:7-carboxy-7-deazaguanine synthase QueE [Gemmatales bacterium]